MAGVVRGLAAAWLVCAIVLAEAAQAQVQDDLARLRAEVGRLFGQGKHADAVPIAQRYVELARQRHGENHPEFVTAITALATGYSAQGRLAEAEPLYKRGLATLEKALGPDHPNLGWALISLADVYAAQGRFAEAELLARRNLAIWEKALGPEHRDVGTTLNTLALLYQAQGRFAEAEPPFRRSLTIREKALGLEHPDVAESLDNLARLYLAQSRRAEADLLMRRSLAIREKALGPDHPAVAESLDTLAQLYLAQSRLAETDPLMRRSLAIREKALGPGHPAVGTSLNNLAMLYQTEGRFAEAEPLHRRGLAIREKALGPEHPHVGDSLNNLAALYLALERPAEAEPLYRRSLAIREKIMGPQHPDVAQSLGNLAGLYGAQGRFAEAEQLYARSLAIREKVLGPNHPDVGSALNSLAGLYKDQGRLAEAEPLYGRSLAIREKVLGPDHPDVGTVLNNLAELYKAQGRLALAEPLHRRALAIREKVLGSEHPYVGVSLNNLAGLYHAQGRFAEAELLFRRSLAVREKALGPDHREVGTTLNNLAALYLDQGRLAEAEPPYRRSLTLIEKALGPEHRNVGTTLNNLAELYRAQGRFAEAEPLYRRGLAILEKTLGPNHPDVAALLNNQGELYRAQGRFDEAEPRYRRSLAIFENALGSEHPDVAGSLNNLGELNRIQGRLDEAEPLYRRSVAILEKTLGPEHPNMAMTLNNLAWLDLVRKDWARAADNWRRSTGIIARRAERGLVGAAEGSFKGEVQQSSWHFLGLVKATHHLLAEGRASGTSAAEMFETAQWAQASAAAVSLAQMAARSAAGSPKLAGLVRERQDLGGEWEAKDKLLIAAKSQEPGKRNAGAEKALADRLGAIEARLAEIGRTLAKDFPNYAALASPAPASVVDVQAQLGADEALVLFLDTGDRFNPLPQETFVWVVTRSQMRWVRSGVGTALRREVAALRCGLDGALWDDRERRARCVALLEVERSDDRANAPPFPVERAHALYKVLFRDVEDLVMGKHLLIVPSGTLTQLPFQALVTAPPKVAGGGYRETAWLGTRQPITVLPAVSSLKALRAHAKASRAGKTYLGIGNPLLDGPDARFAEVAGKARASRRCPVAPTPVATLDAGQGGVVPFMMRGGLANVADIRTQAPLPETAEELCAVARDLKADMSDVRLGDQATEAEVKRLSGSGELARYRVLHFATHGAMAGELSSAREPGLILTPPETASAQDDGYLSASEIAGLNLDADWVILSACNTAAGGTASAEALSGLARAFFYAGARALLVSHWAVASNATVELIKSTVGEMGRDPNVGRAEALRRAMRALVDKGGPEAHPSYWAPFVVVGEGAARQ